ncbi:Pentatricopeptide repeat-containing protein [Abeliophyllum distichum]|uniref:Pentatricopeptide repeat-containing protein n=1 Tax=Abeliophyllum distichum TaxID=126358 RepID=A0ABD1SSI4_9LAMI
MPERNLVTWNSVIAGLAKGGNMELANKVFQRMPERNSVSWNVMISGYIKLGDLRTAQTIFYEIPDKSVVSSTAMVSGYAMIGDIESARRIFYQMPAKNVVSWNAMIAGTSLISVLSACSHVNSLEHGKWIESYIKKNKYELSVPLGNALIDMFAKCGDLDNARVVFRKMSKKCIITWTTMVSGLAVNGHCTEALELFDRMRSEGLKPDDVIFIAVLSACTHGGLLEKGKEVFHQNGA